jgi:hypothetical protein
MINSGGMNAKASSSTPPWERLRDRQHDFEQVADDADSKSSGDANSDANAYDAADANPNPNGNANASNDENGANANNTNAENAGGGRRIRRRSSLELVTFTDCDRSPFASVRGTFGYF